MKDFMCKIHLNNGRTESAFTKKKILIIERLSRWTAYYLIFFFSMNWVTWIWIPVFNNINNMEAIQNRSMKLQTCLYLWVPFDYSYNYQNWVIVHIINTYVVGMGGKENLLLYVVMVTVYMGGLILMSFVLEEIRRQTEDLADVVYGMRWETMSISNQKIFLLFLQRVQPAMEFTALGGLKAGVKPMISVRIIIYDTGYRNIDREVIVMLFTNHN
ncbi:unnamed protein product [Pieris brassicae]|uniref:Odorant receptor n=1 Tax=Pieris brassicae TaxID=7116 RepID=A0A9P0THJ1_PIEBR|nr:unnamed protein product [Pieris brassicae]